MKNFEIIYACVPISKVMVELTTLFTDMVNNHDHQRNEPHHRTVLSLTDNYTFYIDFKRHYATISKDGNTIFKLNREQDVEGMNDPSNVSGIDRGDMVFISSTRNECVHRGIRYKGDAYPVLDSIDNLEEYLFQMEILDGEFPKDDMEVFIMECLLSDDIRPDLYFGLAKTITSREDLWLILRLIREVSLERIMRDMKNNPIPD